MSGQLEARVAAARAKLEAWDERHTVSNFDHGMIHIPLRARNGKTGIDGLARQRAELQRNLDAAEAKLRRAQAAPRLAAEKTAREERHAAIDLKSMHGDKTEVQWALNGAWFKVVRWNKKSVTVVMAGERDTIPHTQIGGVR
ncbi:hypothetical protein ACIFOC_00403 [Leucobacter aridicollis]|uniref:hypothetical protein n=1 Tax=Leucobacter aridicollis TaxID=283878 RepID=UPI0037C54304